MFHRFLINSSGISRLSGKLTDLFSSRGSKARSRFSFHYLSKGGSKSHNLCICVYFFLCEYLLASFSVYVIVYSCVNVHLCVFVCTSACHVSLLERYKPSAFVYICLCCGADMFFGILKLVPTSQCNGNGGEFVLNMFEVEKSVGATSEWEWEGRKSSGIKRDATRNP